MTEPLRTISDYELIVYALPQVFPFIRHSTLQVIRRGATLALDIGEISLGQDIRIVVRERLVFDRSPGVIDGYGYEVWRADGKLFWYDSQPHPGDEALQSTHPHHKHVPPDIKHHRIPAPDLGFARPNLPLLIREATALLERLANYASALESTED